jgi:hypothetical protein
VTDVTMPGGERPSPSDEADPPAIGATGGALRTIVSTSAAPYGYTVTLWSSGALLIHDRSFPGVIDIFTFGAGALMGYTLVGLLVGVTLRALMLRGMPTGRLMFGMLHWFAVGISVGTVAVLAQIPSWFAWPLSSLSATSLYLTCAAIELALVSRTGKRP